jgi:hypothetical protein
MVYQGWKSRLSSLCMRVCVGSGGVAPALTGISRDVQPSAVMGGSNRR